MCRALPALAARVTYGYVTVDSSRLEGKDDYASGARSGHFAG